MQYLADFMETTCAPPKHKFLLDIHRAERAQRIHVSSPDFQSAGNVIRTDHRTVNELRSALQVAYRRDRDRSHPILFVVQDLSQDVIEVLGNELNIDPRFFRGHISDYYWYNIRDPWVELPDLEIFAQSSQYCSVRFFQPRYFLHDEAARAKDELGTFNVLRYVDIGDDRAPAIDELGSSVGLVRSKTSLWTRPDPNENHQVLGESSSLLIWTSS